MAGSYNHVVDRKTGALRKPPSLLGMLETHSGDVYEAVEEMYGMIWYLAYALAGDYSNGTKTDEEWAKEFVEDARQNYKKGLVESPTKRFK